MTEFRKVFIDTAPLIYFLEQNPEYHNKVKSFIEKCYEERTEIVTSVITIEEYCVYPYKNDNLRLIRKMDEFIENMEIGLINIDISIAKMASRIRGEFKEFKSMDALQLASACLNGCDLFLTNDKQLKQFKEIKCIMVNEL